MESDTDDGRSSVSQPRYELSKHSIHEPVRIEVQEDDRRTVYILNGHEVPLSSHAFPVSSQKKDYSLVKKIVIGIVILVLVIVVGLLALKRLMIYFEAFKVFSNMDFDVNPCVDFYNYSCGVFVKIYKSQGIPSHDQFSNIAVQVILKKQGLLEQSVTEHELPIIKKAKLFHQACIAIESINKRGVEPLKDLLINDLGGWPLTYGEWKESNFDLATTLVEINLLGSFPILEFRVFVDLRDNKKTMLKIDQPSLVIEDRNAYLADRKNKELMAYEELITGIATILGLADRTTASEDIKAMVDFEIKLAEISESIDTQRGRSKIFNPMTLEEVQGNYSQIMNWTRYVHKLMSISEINIDITNQEIITNQGARYFEKLIGVMENTPTRTLANYMIWTLVYKLTSNGIVGTIFKAHFDKYEKVEPSGIDLNIKCVVITTTVLPLVVGRMYVEKYFDKEAKALATEMVEELKKAFSELLNESDWLDEETKKYAEDKKNKMVSKIGYPDYIYNDTYIDEVYSGLEKEIGTQYFENMLSCYRYTAIYEFRNMRKPIDHDIWFVPPTLTNAFYMSNLNQIVFPAGILQPPFFSKTNSKAMNFGGIGTVIGHEITHGFDDEGRHYGKDGNLHDWWSDEAEKKFKERAQCMIDQYGNFTWEPINQKVNAIRTLGENIADNGGLKQAFRAYRNWVTSQGKEETMLPDLDFTPNQLFFISFAQVWCKHKNDELAKFILNTDHHSPFRFRVIGAVQNSKEFSETFNCPIDSKMNPSKKCHVW